MESRHQAPGRVNLIGEHTDYNDGLVLPTVIPQRTRVALRRRADRRVIAESAGHGRAEYQLGSESRRGEWIDYVQGVTWALGRAGHSLGGFEVAIESEIPAGAGLSSSAALEVALLRALRDAFSLTTGDLELAKLAQRGENEIVGAPVGLLDPLACSLARPGEALFVDTRTLAMERVAIPGSIELAVIDSGVTHDHSRGDYRARRAECEAAARMLGVASLRDIGLEAVAALPRPLDRRARHVVRENARVLETVAALRADDHAALRELFADSHASMRDDYECSVPEVDALVERAMGERDVIGARLTGGGFGGAIVVLARAGTARAAAERIGGTRVLVPSA